MKDRTPAPMRQQVTRLAILVVLLESFASVVAQSATVRVDAGALHIKAPAFHFLKGALLDRLKNGRSARLDIDVTVLARPASERLAQRKQQFILSYDLWEERFAVTDLGPPSRSMSHLTTADAEAWCLDRVSVPASALGTSAAGTPFWLRLEYVVQRDRGETEATTDQGDTIQGLIDRLSRRRSSGDAHESIEIGPFRLSS